MASNAKSEVEPALDSDELRGTDKNEQTSASLEEQLKSSEPDLKDKRYRARSEKA